MKEKSERFKDLISIMNIQRRRKKMSAYRLAAETGITCTGVVRYLDGRTEPGIEKVFLLCDALDIDLKIKIK